MVVNNDIAFLKIYQCHMKGSIVSVSFNNLSKPTTGSRKNAKVFSTSLPLPAGPIYVTSRFKSS